MRKTPEKLPLLKVSIILLLATVLGFFMVLLYPLLIVLWLAWREHERAVLLSAAMPSPSVRCDGGMEGKAEQAFEKPALEPVELPREFAELFKRKDWK